MCKRSFPARLPSKLENSRCENEAFLQDFPQKLKAEDVNTKLCKSAKAFQYNYVSALLLDTKLAERNILKNVLLVHRLSVI